MIKGTAIKPIPEEKQAARGWKAEVNGEPVERVESIVITHPKFGTLAYGMTPGGWDGWSFHEVGGGGSVIVPFFFSGEFGGEFDTNSLFVGVVEQLRPNQGGKVLNCPRGFLSPGENHFQAAKRELGEETGFEPLERKLVLLPGAPTNCNSTFFETIEEGEGAKFFCIRIMASEVIIDHHGQTFAYRFKPGMIRADPASKAAKLAEQILGCWFIHWQEAMNLSDMWTVAAVGRLLKHVNNRNPR